MGLSRSVLAARVLVAVGAVLVAGLRRGSAVAWARIWVPVVHGKLGELEWILPIGGLRKRAS